MFQWVIGGNGSRNKLSNLIRECKDLLGKGWSHEIRHVYRECNQVANRLTVMTMGLPYRKVRLWQAVPRELEEVLIHDQMGLCWSRRVCNS